MTSKRHRTFDVMLDGILMSVRCTFDVEPRVFGVGISVDAGVDTSADIGVAISVDGGVGISVDIGVPIGVVSTSTSAFLSALIHGHQNTSKALMVV